MSNKTSTAIEVENSKHVGCTCHAKSINDDDDEISLVEIVKIIWKYRLHLLLFVACFFALTCVYLIKTPDLYKAEAIIMPLQGRSTIALPSNLLGIEGLKEMIGENMPGMLEAPNSSKIRSLLTSRRLNLMLVEKFDLLPVLFEEKWDKSKQRWYGETDQASPIRGIWTSIKRFLGANSVSFNPMPTPLDGSEFLQKKIVAQNIRKENLLKIEFEDRDPNFALTMVTRYIDALDEYLRFEAITRANDSKNYIDTLLQAQTGNQTKKRLEELSLAFAEQELYAKMKSSFLFEVVDAPILPEKPFAPKRMAILALSILASLFAGILLIFITEALKKNFKSSL